MDQQWTSSSLDRSENATLGAAEQRTQSQNMDDTGFFSISVLEKVSSDVPPRIQKVPEVVCLIGIASIRLESCEMAESRDGGVSGTSRVSIYTASYRLGSLTPFSQRASSLRA
jgi:hypothetical protein